MAFCSRVPFFIFALFWNTFDGKAKLSGENKHKYFVYIKHIVNKS